MPKLIHQTHDAYGEISVYDDGRCRLLAFAPGDEQGICLKADPAQLQFEYTQAMLLALLWGLPRRVLCLGLGAGSLMTALHRHCPNARLTAVELREAMIEIAHKYFYLPKARRLQIHCQDAMLYIALPGERYDLIFSDLYTARGASPLQTNPEFLAGCARRLKPDGWLVLNLWWGQMHEEQLAETLGGYFAEMHVCPTSSGNWLVFAGKMPLRQSPGELKLAARGWSAQLGFSLTRHLAQLRPLAP